MCMRWDIRFQECKNDRKHFKLRPKNILHGPDCRDHKACGGTLTQEQKFWDRKGACPSCLLRESKIKLGQTETKNEQDKSKDADYASKDAQDAFEDSIDGSGGEQDSSEDEKGKSEDGKDEPEEDETGDYIL